MIEIESPASTISRVHSLRPEFLFLAGSLEQDIEIVKQRQQWPNTISGAAAVAAGVHAFLEHVGELSEGIVGPTPWEPSLRIDAVYGPRPEWASE
jgi:hypothetical protein